MFRFDFIWIHMIGKSEGTAEGSAGTLDPVEPNPSISAFRRNRRGVLRSVC